MKNRRACRLDHAHSDGRKIAIGDGCSAISHRHADFAGLMDPLIMVDHFVKTKLTFGTRAHAGLSAVALVFEDSVGASYNRDQLGKDIDLALGDLYWFKPACGALHNEEPRPGARTHALQVFVNRPEEKCHEAPVAFHLPAGYVPHIAGDRASARLVLGEAGGPTLLDKIAEGRPDVLVSGPALIATAPATLNSGA